MTARASTATIVALIACLLAGCGASTQSTDSTSANKPAAPSSSERPATAESNTVTVPSASQNEAALPVFFNALSPWNTAITSLPADPHSRELLGLAGLRPVIAEAPAHQGATGTIDTSKAGIYINTTSWAPTIVTEQGGVPTKLECRQVLCGPDAGSLSSALISPNVNPDPRYEGWLTIVDRSGGAAYDLWRARRQADGSISYQYIKRWKLNGPGFSRPESANPQGAVSARGSGLPLFAGAILPGELRNGDIRHALAIAVPGAARGAYVQPASTTDGVGSENSLPEGARVRLRGGVRLTGLSGTRLHYADVILAALRRYGAIVVDLATVPTLYAQRGSVGGLLNGEELRSLRLSDFEVVRLPKLLHVATDAQAGALLSADVKTESVG